MSEANLRQRVLAWIAGLLIAGVVLVFWIFQPLSAALTAAGEGAAMKESRLDSVKRLLQRSDRISERYGALRGYFSAEAGESSSHEFLNSLERLASEHQLQLNLKPRGMKVDEGLQTFEVEMEIQGPQEGILGFLDSLFAMKALMAIDRLRLTNAATREHALKGDILLRQITPAPKT